MAELLLGIDLGTTKCQASAFDRAGRLCAQHSEILPIYYPGDGWVEQHAEDWAAALTLALRQVATQLGPRVLDLCGISVAANGPVLVLVDGQGRALAPCPNWQDQRSAGEGEYLNAILAANWIGGLGPPKTGLAAKLLWAKKHWPDLFENCAQALDLKAWVIHWLTGKYATDPSSGPGADEWPEPVFEAIGFPLRKLPRVYPPTATIGGLDATVASRCGFSSGIPVYLGLNDGASSTLGTGSIAPGDACVSIGTNGVGRLVLPRPFDAARALQLGVFAWPYVPDRWVVGGMVLTGGAALAWLREALDPSVPFETLLSEAADSAPGARGVTFLPYLAGRSIPYPCADARAAFIGLSLRHSRSDMVRAVLEGVAYAIREVFQLFRDEGFSIGDMRITGGGAQDPLWQQIISDVLDRRLIRTDGDAALGSAIVAAVGSGQYKDVPEAVRAMVRLVGEARPDATRVSLYDASFQEYQRLTRALGYAKQPDTTIRERRA